MKRYFQFLGVCSIMAFISYYFLKAEKFEIKSAYFNVSGTSNLHDWSIISTNASSQAVFVLSENSITEVKELKISIPAESFKSNRKGMDKNTREALKAELYPEIEFQLNKLIDLKHQENSSMITAEGELFIAGVSRNIKLNVTGIVEEEEVLTFKGTHTLKLTNYNIDPSTAVMGTVKTGDGVKISFNVSFKSQNSVL